MKSWIYCLLLPNLILFLFLNMIEKEELKHITRFHEEKKFFRNILSNLYCIPLKSDREMNLGLHRTSLQITSKSAQTSACDVNIML